MKVKVTITIKDMSVESTIIQSPVELNNYIAIECTQKAFDTVEEYLKAINTREFKEDIIIPPLIIFNLEVTYHYNIHNGRPSPMGVDIEVVDKNYEDLTIHG